MKIDWPSILGLLNTSHYCFSISVCFGHIGWWVRCQGQIKAQLTTKMVTENGVVRIPTIAPAIHYSPHTSVGTYSMISSVRLQSKRLSGVRRQWGNGDKLRKFFIFRVILTLCFEILGPSCASLSFQQQGVCFKIIPEA